MRIRPRRLRSGDAIRAMVAESGLSCSDLVWPLFIHDEAGDAKIGMMPGVSRLGEAGLLRACEDAARCGVRAVALFPAVEDELRTPMAEEAHNDGGLVQRSVRLVKKRFPELLVVVDVALDPFTSHGHDGILTGDGRIANDETVGVLVLQARSLAGSGADIVAPSDMMDGRVAAIRDALEDDGHEDTKILSYAAKYASVFYGPFRDAIGSAGRLKGDKRTYQMDPANINEALREVALDVSEGADMVMVKPGMPYLDVVREVAGNTSVPVFAYQVSGEYAMIEAAVANGWIDGEAAMLESLLAFKRAGCSGVFTYYALRAARAMRATQQA